MPNIMLELRVFLPALLFGSTVVVGHVNHTHEEKADMLKQKWTMDNVIRDMELANALLWATINREMISNIFTEFCHIKEDLASVLELADIGQLSENEMAFYLIRMHDFDDNGKLDGHELRVASEHSLEHMAGVPSHLKEGEIEKIIDEALKMDLNLDGFIDFGEFKMQAQANANKH